MLEYIKENKNSFSIIKSAKNFGRFKNLDDAIFIRDLLNGNNWDVNSLEEIYYKDNV